MSLWCTGSIGTICSTIVLLLLKSHCWVTNKKEQADNAHLQGSRFYAQELLFCHFVAFVQHLKSMLLSKKKQKKNTLVLVCDLGNSYRVIMQSFSSDSFVREGLPRLKPPTVSLCVLESSRTVLAKITFCKVQCKASTFSLPSLKCSLSIEGYVCRCCMH